MLGVSILLQLFLPVDKENMMGEQRLNRVRPAKKFAIPEPDDNVVVLDPHVLAEPGTPRNTTLLH
jgi:hypothetical protein